jgi:hypothetical protein
MIDEIQDPRRAEFHDPVEDLTQDFDWQGLYECLGEDARNSDNDARLVETVVRLLQLLLGNTTRPARPWTIGLRVIALAWVLSPTYFKGSPSLCELARRYRAKASRLSEMTGEVSRWIGWRNRGQCFGWNRRLDGHPEQKAAGIAWK